MMTLKEIISENMRKFNEMTNQEAEKIVERVWQYVSQIFLPKNYKLYVQVGIGNGAVCIRMSNKEDDTYDLPNGEYDFTVSNIFFNEEFKLNPDIRTDNVAFEEYVLIKVAKALVREGGKIIERPECFEDINLPACALQFDVRNYQKRKK